MTLQNTSANGHGSQNNIEEERKGYSICISNSIFTYNEFNLHSHEPLSLNSIRRYQNVSDKILRQNKTRKCENNSENLNEEMVALCFKYTETK